MIIRFPYTSPLTQQAALDPGAPDSPDGPDAPDAPDAPDGPEGPEAPGGPCSPGGPIRITGGQHRSVYFAERLEEFLRLEFPEVGVRLFHREEPYWP